MSRKDLINQRTKKGRGYGPRKKTCLQDPGITVELIGEFVHIRDECSMPTVVATFRANEALLLARYVLANQEELIELAGGEPIFWRPKDEAEIAGARSREFCGLTFSIGTRSTAGQRQHEKEGSGYRTSSQSAYQNLAPPITDFYQLEEILGIGNYCISQEKKRAILSVARFFS